MIILRCMNIPGVYGNFYECSICHKLILVDPDSEPPKKCPVCDVEDARLLKEKEAKE